MELKKVTHLINTLKFGGAERFLLDVYPHLDHAAYEHTVCSLLNVVALPTESIHRLQFIDKQSLWLRLHQTQRAWVKPFRALLFFYYLSRSARHIKGNTADLTVVSICQLGIAYSMMDKLLKRRFPHLWVLRVGSDLDSPVYFPRGLRGLCLFLVKPLFRMMLQQAPAVICTDEALREKLIVNYGVSANKIHTVPNCQVMLRPQEDAAQQAADYGINQRTFIAVGRLHPQKGFDFLIRVFALFARLYPQYSLVIIGEGGERRALEKLIASLGIEDKVRLTGFINQPETLMPYAKACIVPSRSEGFCKVVVEAMWAKTLVLASDCDFGPRSIIQPGQNGFLFASEQEQSLLDALITMVGLPDEQVRTIRAQALLRAEAFSAETVGATFQRVIQNLVAS